MRSVPFVDRDSQVDAVLGYAAEAAAGQGRVVLVEGEAGAGKSTLLEEVETRLSGAEWHWGACDGLFTPLPLAPLRDVAEGLGGPLLAAMQVDSPRERLFGALLEAMRAREHLVVLVVEDVHWADEATLDLLRHTGRRIGRERALLLVTFRNDESNGVGPATLRQVVGELSRQRATRRISVAPLSRVGVARLVEGTRFDAAEIHALTGGNPFFVSEVLRGDGSHLPATARDAVLARVEPLGPRARGLLSAAAIAGNRVSPDLLSQVVDDEGPPYADLLAAGLLVTDAAGLRFRHEIARLAVADAVAEPLRSSLHSRLLECLEQRDVGDDARLAFHADGTGDAAAALRYSTAAGRRASAMAAHVEGVAHYRRALTAVDRLQDGGPRPGVATPADMARTRAHVLGALATELGLVDEWGEAVELWEEALGLWRGLGDRVREGDTQRMRSRALWRMARGAQAETAVRDAVALLEPLGPSPELARALKDLAGIAMTKGQHETSVAAADRAVDLATSLDLPDVLSDALDTRACTMMQLGQDWVPVMQQAVQVGLDGACDEQVARAYTNFYGGLVGAGRAGEGEQLYVDAMEFCEEREVASFGNCLVATRVEALAAGGRWEDAWQLGSGRLDTATVSLNNWMHFMLSLGRIGVRRGQQGIDADLVRAVQAADDTGEPQWIVPFRLLLAERDWIAGRLQEARQQVASALEAAAAVPGDGALGGPATLWAARLGVPVALGLAVGSLWAPSVDGGVAAAVERWEVAEMPYEAALVLAFSREPDDGVEAVRRLDALGAVPVAACVRRRLRDDGIRSPGAVRPSTRAHPAGLTAREQEVLEQLAHGCTNEEIARRLVISTRTAGHHVSAVLTKLGVQGRRQAVVEAARLGLVMGPTETGVRISG